MNGFETIQVTPNCVWHVLPDDGEQQKPQSAESKKLTKEPGISIDQKSNLVPSPSVLDIANKMNWKVGTKDVRQIGQGKMPAPGQRIEMNGWLVMQATDYSGIVTQEALERVQILLDEGAKIKGLLVADDNRHHKPNQFQIVAGKIKDRVKAIDWGKAKKDISESTKVVATAISAKVASISGQAKEKASEVDWGKVKKTLGTGFKAIAMVMAGVASLAAAALILPLLAIVAAPIALFAIDPWLIVVDEEDRFFVIAEWWD